MHFRCKKGSYEYVDNSEFCIHEPASFKGRWNEVFGNGNPIHLEIGTGRGAFITQCSIRNPDINYVGIELYSSPLYKAVKKAEETGMSNIRFIRMNAEFLTDVFEKNEISRIYLNFSDPWPKNSKGSKRLTSGHFLEKYDAVLHQEGHIEFKTDNVPLFEFTLSEAEANEWTCSELTDDLHADGNPEWNVMTDYEMSFVEKGVPIHRTVLSRVHSKE